LGPSKADTMVQELTLVWLSATGLKAHQGDLDAWSKAHDATLKPPAVVAPSAYDPAVAEAIELELESARTAVAVQQAGPESVASACRLIAEHPDLPQAAWLMAECQRLTAIAWLQSGSSVEAAQQHRAADALEGHRAPVYSLSAAPLAPLEPGAVVEIEAKGPRASDDFYLDGERVSLRTLTGVGSHHVRVIRHDIVLWSGWLEVAAQGGPLNIPLAVQPCATSDVSDVVLNGDQPSVPSDVQCPNWLIARSARGSGIDLWHCHAEVCNQSERWPLPTIARNETRKETSSGGWYVWPLVGVGVALGTAAVLWQTGAFDSSQEPRRSFSITGPEASGALINF